MKKAYAGSCHCGAVRFRFKSGDITTGLRCNCSICVRKGTVMSTPYFAPEDFEEIQGLSSLTLYRWGDQEVNNWFCSKCGIHTFHDAVQKPGHYRVNLGCVDGLDIFSLEIGMVDGRSY